jgi:UDP-glucose 4-epimerase
MTTILVTGAAGYIGSHACVELLEAGYDIVALDNLSNSSEESLRRVQKLAGRKLVFHELDLVDEEAVRGVFALDRIDCVMHFAGKKAVGESVEIPLQYFHNNVGGTINLLRAMEESGTSRLIFSSSCTVYGVPDRVPITEDSPLHAASPYGRTKLVIEEMCRDVAASGPWKIVLLRYFNPVGAHHSGTIGEDPKGIPNNLMPFALQVAVGRRDHLNVFGNDYPTADGTGVRDYIHVMDLARGHVNAVPYLDEIDGCVALNLGTGRGHSVLEVVKSLSAAVGADIPYEFAPRRPGDVPELYADPSRAEKELGWRAEKNLDDICADSWRWQNGNPNGYGI